MKKLLKLQELTGLTGSKLQLSINGFEPAVLLASTAADLGALIAELSKMTGPDTEQIK